MHPDPWIERLSEAVDGALAAEDAALLEAHLATCDECRTVLSDLRAVAAQARALPPEIAPPADLWPAVESRIAAFARSASAVEEFEADPSCGPPVRGTRPGRRGGLVLSWPQLAAAGIALVLLSGGGMWFAVHRAGSGAAGGSGTGVVAQNTASGPTGGAGAVPAGAENPATDPSYAREVADLERALDEHRAQLDPQTVRTIESNLHIIDLATAQARQALAADPSNPYLKAYLSRTMQRKVDVLKQATVFASAP
jgi:anti-sigma factor RsiW